LKYIELVTITSSTAKPSLKIFLETAMNYLQNKYNISRHFLKTLLHYRVKHKPKSLKWCNCSTNSWWQSCTAMF